MTDSNDTAARLEELHAQDTSLRDALTATREAFEQRSVLLTSFSASPSWQLGKALEEVERLVKAEPSGDALELAVGKAMRNARLAREAAERQAAQKQAIKDRDAVAGHRWVDEFNRREQARADERRRLEQAALAELRGEATPAPAQAVAEEPRTAAGF